MPRGGRRKGRVGKAYANRTDLNGPPDPLPVQAASGQAYGVRKAQEDAQRAVPVSAPPRPAQTAMAAPPVQGPLPGSFGSLTRPTDRPHEPVTNGIASGAGVGPEALGLDGRDPAADELRAIYLRYPTEALRELLEDLDSEL